MLTDESKMPFGVHKGKAMANVPNSYLKWLYEKGTVKGDLREYIEDNAEIIGIEIER